jgi:hypothetical protein
MRTLLLIAALACLTAFASLQSATAAGVDATQARHLANLYRLYVLDMGCGGVGVPLLHGDWWEVPVHAGWAGAHEGDIRVSKIAGLTAYSYGGKVYPTMTPRELRRRHLDGNHRQT